MVTGLHHISMIVSSEEVVDFYKTKFGFTEIKRVNRAYDTVVILECSGVRLELFVDDRHASRLNPEPLGLRNLSLKVEDIEGTAAELGTENIDRDWFGQRYLIVSDPDGNVVQLHE